jgi:hypothetical protein
VGEAAPWPPVRPCTVVSAPSTSQRSPYFSPASQNRNHSEKQNGKKKPEKKAKDKIKRFFVSNYRVTLARLVKHLTKMKP